VARHPTRRCPVELVFTYNGKLSGYRNLDYETIRPTMEAGHEGDDEGGCSTAWARRQ
jgi:hypothetical protein